MQRPIIVQTHHKTPIASPDITAVRPVSNETDAIAARTVPSDNRNLPIEGGVLA